MSNTRGASCWSRRRSGRELCRVGVTARASGVSSTLPLLDSITAASGILDHPLARVTTIWGRHCERSEAIHGATEAAVPTDRPPPPTPPRHARCAWREGSAHTSAFSPHAFARGLPDSCRLAPEKGAGNAGRSMRPTVSCARWSRRRTRAYRSHRIHPAFPAQWFYGLLRALPGDRAGLSPSPTKLPLST
jgi:hypothetical protein